MNKSTIIKSSEDNSVNFIQNKNIGYLESRYVRRIDDYFIVYLSSQTGCDQACRMCHLTATGQNKLVNSTLEDFSNQADQVLSYYKSIVDSGFVNKANNLHYNFMARGEPLNNDIIRDKEMSKILFNQLNNKALNLDLKSRMLISTIIPKSFENIEFNDIFSDYHPDIYYSLYSVNDLFRKKWLNNALNPELSIQKLKRWENITTSKIKIHYAFIKKENDSEKDVIDVCNLINKYQLNADFNIVRYNPYSDKYGEESDEKTILKIEEILNNELKDKKIKVIPRVGFDVKASCGMFIK